MGKRAIWQPTVITESGYYVLTEDIISEVQDPPPTITIQARDVTLDLNGHSISSLAQILVLLDVRHGNTIIKNGHMRNAEDYCIYSDSIQTLRIKDVIFNQCYTGITIKALEEVEITGCSFEIGGPGPLMDLNDGGKFFGGRICDNRIDQVAGPSAIVVSGLQNSEVSGNLVEQYGAPGYPGTGAGLLLAGDSTGNVIRNNILNDGGEKVPGIEVHGSRNLIEGNQISGNGGPGILFGKDSSDNAFRQNMLRGNTQGAVIDQGTGNTDEGGNIL